MAATKKAVKKRVRRPVLESLRVVDDSGTTAVQPVDFMMTLLRQWVADLSRPNDSPANAAAIAEAFNELRTTARDTLEARGRRMRPPSSPVGRPPSKKTAKARLSNPPGRPVKVDADSLGRSLISDRSQRRRKAKTT